MTSDDLRALGADDLLAQGRRAHGDGDVSRLRACLRELGFRSSRKAGVAESELRGLLRAAPQIARRNVPEADATVEAARILILKDRDILQHRIGMIDRAKRSVWMSSLTFPDSELVDALARKGRHIERVHLVVAERTVRDGHDKDLARLDRAGVDCKLLRSTHSKLLVIDENLVMVGSANAHHVHRDVCVVFRDARKAQELIEYMDRLS